MKYAMAGRNCLSFANFLLYKVESFLAATSQIFMMFYLTKSNFFCLEKGKRHTKNVIKLSCSAKTHVSLDVAFFPVILLINTSAPLLLQKRQEKASN